MYGWEREDQRRQPLSEFATWEAPHSPGSPTSASAHTPQSNLGFVGTPGVAVVGVDSCGEPDFSPSVRGMRSLFVNFTRPLPQTVLTLTPARRSVRRQKAALAATKS